MRRGARSSTRRRANSLWRSACATSVTCRRSRGSSSCRTALHLRPSSRPMAKLRLNKILAQAGLTSRRGADRLVLDGHVIVNGVVVREPGTLADPHVDDVRLDGRRVGPAEARQYLVL